MARDRRKRAGRRAGSFRTCAGCGRKRPLAKTVRLVRGPDGSIHPDLFAKLPGRGAHVCPDLACIHQAFERGGLARAFRAEVRGVNPDALGEAFVRVGHSQIQALLATASRSGWLQPGRDEVRAGLSGHRTALVLIAEDAADNLRNQIQDHATRDSVPCKTIMNKDELARFHKGRALAVIGIGHRGLAARLRDEIERTQALVESGKKWRETAHEQLGENHSCP